ncbi:MAG: HAMP domain-containing histidine kinase [Clostridiales bacterium]|nr:HAMP domain-containing histidine kinase [Clostridiales bacterium]
MTWKIFNGIVTASGISVLISYAAYIIYYEVKLKPFINSSSSESNILLKSFYVVIIALACCAAVSFISSYFLSKKISRDMENMGDDIEHISKNCVYEELKPFADKIQIQLDEKEKLLNMKKRFTANVSHELKTPLTSISGYGEMLESGMVAANDIPKIGGIIYKESQRLINLTHDIIQLSQLEEYDYKPIIDFVDVMPVINYCVEALSVKAQKKNVEITVNGADCKVKGTKSLIEELIYNLVENAVKYNIDGGKVNINTQSGDDFVYITVSDTGIGIPEKYQERVFERFFRVDKSRSKATGGTGLGLAIVKHTADYLGGSVSLKSVENKGTEITVKLAK